MQLTPWACCFYLARPPSPSHPDPHPTPQAVTKTCTTILRANLIISRVDLAVSHFPGVLAAPLVLGTISGCGGRLLVDGLKFGWGAMPGRAELSEPGWTSRSSFVAAAAYYASAYGLALAEPRAVAGLLVTAMVGFGGRPAGCAAAALRQGRVRAHVCAPPA